MEVRKERRAVLADAAIDVVAEDGMRALTHRAVDARAGLPTGTTSAYFRTRQALLTALVRRLAELDRVELEALGITPEQTAAGPSGSSEQPGKSGESGPSGQSEQPGPPSGAELDAIAEGTALFVQHWLTTGRNRALARYRCLLETTAYPELREILAPHESMARVQARRLFERAGVEDPAGRARSYVAAIDGLILDLLLGEPVAPEYPAAAVRRLLGAHCGA